MIMLALFLLGITAIGFARIVQDRWGQNWSPAFVADFLTREHVLPGGAHLNAQAFPRVDNVAVDTTAAAQAGDTTLSVEALPAPLAAGTGMVAGSVVVRLNQAAPAGATTLHVDPLGAPVALGASVLYRGHGRIQVLAGTLVGRTAAQAAAREGLAPADVEAHDELFLTVHDVRDAEANADVALVRPGTLLRENMLPGWESRPESEKAAIRERYQTTHGQP